MIKILDSSAVSSMGMEIASVDVLGHAKAAYTVCVTDAVAKECGDSHDDALIDSVSGLAIACEGNGKLGSVKSVIEKADVRLGPGETETIAASILLTASGVDNYAVIDEKLARRIVKDLHLNRELRTVVGKSISPIKCTGTVGLIRHLRDKGLLSAADTAKIADDLKTSRFRVSDELLSLLRRSRPAWSCRLRL